MEASSLSGKATAVIEFARGREHGGFSEAFSHFSGKLLRQAAILYIDVSFEESLRKNRKRFNPDKPYSILEHALPDEKLKRLYGESDWPELCSADPDYLHLKGTRVPYKVFENMDDVTTKGGEALAGRLRSGSWTPSAPAASATSTRSFTSRRARPRRTARSVIARS